MMYAPAPFFSEGIEVAGDLVETLVMGTLVTAGLSLQGSPLPFMFDPDGDNGPKLISHMDRRNPLWREMENGRDVMVIFWGANAYISPSLYLTRPRVPTWVYTTAHIGGKPRLVHDRAGVDKIVTDLCHYMEQPGSGWDISQVGDYKEKLLGSIVGFEVDIASAQSQVRLGQQNDREEFMAVYSALSRGTDGEKQVAATMRRMGMISGNDV